MCFVSCIPGKMIFWIPNVLAEYKILAKSATSVSEITIF